MGEGGSRGQFSHFLPHSTSSYTRVDRERRYKQVPWAMSNEKRRTERKKERKNEVYRTYIHTQAVELITRLSVCVEAS